MLKLYQRFNPVVSLAAQTQSRNFTRAFRKIVLTEDIAKLGFKGEICFVKPGFALNHLVPKKRAIFFTDPAALEFLDVVSVSTIRQ